MKNSYLASATLGCAAWLALAWPSLAEGEAAGAKPADNDLPRLVAAYPDFLEAIAGNELVWKDGTRMQIDDGKKGKDHETLLATADIDDMFFTPYVPGPPAKLPALNEDPGRARNAALFNKMYGDCMKGGVEKNLVDVVWLPKKSGKTIKVTRVNGVDKKLALVSAELDKLPPKFDKYLFPSAGTYVCRPIAGTTRVSAHGHGIAMDISTKHSHYWRWAGGDIDKVVYKNEIPIEIVEIFEKHGFIWGGKWYHYDTMHFEYRPELLPGK